MDLDRQGGSPAEPGRGAALLEELRALVGPAPTGRTGRTPAIPRPGTHQVRRPGRLVSANCSLPSPE